MITLDGRLLAQTQREKIKEEIAISGLRPGLAAILVGNDPASHLYVALKETACAEVGIHFEKNIFPETATEKEVLTAIAKLNQQKNIHGILIQLPLPGGWNTEKIFAAMDPTKDVDGFHPQNKLVEPVLAKAVWELIKDGLKKKQTAINSQKALIIGNSDIFLNTLAGVLTKKGLTTKTKHREEVEADKNLIKNYSVVIVAAGQADFLTGADFANGAIVIDIGINHLPNGKITGDVNWQSVQDKNIYITPVPGGVGPMTVAMLLENTVQLAKLNT